jgi:putative alpha-1,2-mannosidase
MSFCKGFTQGGSNADVVLVDAFIKRVSNVSWDEAYEAIINDAENQPQNWRVQGRGGLKSWAEVGYVPYDDHDPGGLNTRSISRTVEVSWLITLTFRHD